MDLPGLKLHPLKGELKGIWSVWVSGNWPIVFRFEVTDDMSVG
jgi:proteic killer suppression protein